MITVDLLYAAAMKYKRFKTLVFDYLDAVPELDYVQWVYYMDIDVLAGAPFRDLVKGAEEKYQMITSKTGETNDTVAKIYFFSDVGQAKTNSGFIIMDRDTSKYCLDLWREEIDAHPESRRDQIALYEIARRYDLGVDTKCQLVSMDHDGYVSYPRTDGEIKRMTNQAAYPYLIHILNSYKAESLDRETVEAFVADVLQLSQEEKEGHKFGKAVIHPSWRKWNNHVHVSSSI